MGDVIPLVQWQPCLMGWCEKAYVYGALLHVVPQTNGDWWWEVHLVGGDTAGNGRAVDKATAQRCAVEHAGRAVAPAGE